MKQQVKTSGGALFHKDHPLLYVIKNFRRNCVKLPVEILAPAGSVESMKAAVNAGADAVYMGGSRFGARAYAENPEGDQFWRPLIMPTFTGAVSI